jgi:hypothetical protein
LTVNSGSEILRSHTENINTSHMRTKTLLLTAALAAIGVTSSMAQVYSVNLVGYINKQIPAGFYMVANQLNNGTGNKVVDLIPNPPEGTIVYKFNPASGGYLTVAFLDGAYEGVTTMTLAPGEGAFIKSPSAHTATFVGEVVLSSATTVPSGFSVLSSVVPQAAKLDTIGFPAVEGDIIYNFNPVTGGYKVSSYLDGAWEGAYGGAPTPDIGESFFVKHTGAPSTWTRTFTVN